MTGQFDYVHYLGGWYDGEGRLHWPPGRMGYPKPFGRRRLTLSPGELDEALQRISPRVWDEMDDD